jgi:uroporphyrinogen decarboxylase
MTQDVAECTLQPLRRYNVDAAILFSDILVLVQALQMDVTMPGGVGIQVPNPLAEAMELEHRIPTTDQMTPEYVQAFLGHVFRSIQLIRERMQEENLPQPLIGFSAAPWTLLFYMVGGSSKKNTDIGMTWLRENPAESKRLLETLTKLVVEYMSAQIEAGCHMLQLFEAMGMMIEEAEFYNFAFPCLEAIAKELKLRFPTVPLMVFARGASFANARLAQAGFDVITLDGSVDRLTARDIVGNHVSLQGNYDPAELIAENGKTVETVQATARQLLQELGPQRLIANLGEGLGGKESPELVKAFVDTIHKESAAMMAQGVEAAEAVEA